MSMLGSESKKSEKTTKKKKSISELKKTNG